METTLQRPAFAAAMNTAKTKAMVYWIVTALFCLQMSFTAYAQLRLPQVAAAFTHFGFPAYFRVELSWAKLIGVVLMLAPAPARLKEWAYAGFAINLASALIAHLAAGVALGGLFFAIGAFFPGSIGMGDAKLGFLLGVALGSKTLLAVMAGLLGVVIVGVGMMLTQGIAARKKAIPFGPFLALGGILGFFLS